MSRETFEAWAPPGREWSQWAKPAPFIGELTPGTLPDAVNDDDDVTATPEQDLCIVLDMPGERAVRMAIKLAKRGFQPVPLINTTKGGSPAIEMSKVISELQRGAHELVKLNIAEDAPPVFVLDSRRDGGGYRPRPRTYDNRWMTFPQDFPSGNYLSGRGIRRAVVIIEGVTWDDDLGHVLRRWQDAGIKIFRENPGDGLKPVEVTVNKPSMFKQGWYRFLAAIGLKRNHAGGFGGRIPEPSQSGGYG